MYVKFLRGGVVLANNLSMFLHGKDRPPPQGKPYREAMRFLQ